MLLALMLTAADPVVLTQLREFTLAAPLADGRKFLAAASGIVKQGTTVYVVADDELELGIFSGDAPGTLLKVFPGELPADHKARKAAKPDHEALTLLDKDLLLAVPSGSTENRRRGALVDTRGHRILHVDFTRLYEELAKRFKELNIEGAAVVGNKLVLLQRGNGAEAENAIVQLDLAKVRTQASKGSVDESTLLNVRGVDLGLLDGVTLSFTDASPLPDGRMVFIAAAEASANTYDDGEVKGSVVGIIDAKGKIVEQRAMTPKIKAEGVHATLEKNGDITLLVCNDADDPTKPAILFRGVLTRGLDKSTSR